MRKNNKIKVASFFSGIGGFDLGFEQAGMKIVFQCEVNNFCNKVLKKHWPKTKSASDINKLLFNHIPDADLWCGGFPCQDLSLANQGKRRGLDGERSGLFFKFTELLSKKKETNEQPRWVVLENVPGLLNSHQGEDFRILIQNLDELGYGLSWRVFDAKYFGTPQRRRRVFIVGSFGGLSSSKVLFDSKPDNFPFETGRRKGETFTKKIHESIRETDIYSIQHASIGRKHTAGPQAKGYKNDGETYTLDSRGGADAVCKTNDAFRIRKTSGLSRGLDGNRYRAVGNAVAVPVIEWIGKRIVLEDNNLKKIIINQV